MPRGQTKRSTTITIGATSGRLIAPDEVMRKVENFYPNREGGFISGVAPTPYHPKPGAGGAPTYTAGSANAPTSVYGITKGIGHCLVNGGQRELLLLHTDDQIWEFRGWLQKWFCIIGPASKSPLLEAKLPKGEPTAFPTQFIPTPTGMIIVPQGGRSYFYDGRVAAPLGYDSAPSPPTAMGPESSSDVYIGTGAVRHYHGVNDIGYAVDALQGRWSGMNPVFARGRVGTIQTVGEVAAAAGDPADSQHVMGYLLPGRWRARCQWVDRWGNLSPISGPSEDIVFVRQPATGGVAGGPGFTSYWVAVDNVLKQVCWNNIPTGPDGTIGRQIYRTRDLVNSGSASFFKLPLDAMAVVGSFATIPDNVCDLYPDNIPDAWLGSEAEEVAPVPEFKLGVISMGQLWVANWPGGEGAIRPSKRGQWGTFLAGRDIWPDPTGPEITGIHAVSGGFLAFTANSTFLVTPADDSNGGVQIRSLSSTQGCVAPDSIATMRSGLTVWLGRDGFYAFDGSSVSYLWEDLRQEAVSLVAGGLHSATGRFDPASGEYRCWVASKGAADSTTSYRYDGTYWRWWRSVSSAHGVTVTRDNRALMLTCGIRSGADGVWVEDHGQTAVTSTLESGWIRSTTDARASIRRVRLWLRETAIDADTTTQVQISARRDWRADIVSTGTVRRFPEQEEVREPDAPQPSFLDNAETWATARWRSRRPFWSKCDIDIPSCEVFQLKITATGRFEILGFQFEESDRNNSGARDFS